MPLIHFDVLHDLFCCSSYILLSLMAVQMFPFIGRLDKAILSFFSFEY